MKIMYLNGALTGQTLELPPSGATIGRECDNTVQLPMGGVSRYHAKIECDASGKWLIRDLGSTNGTLVDDFPVIGASPLANGSVITIGDQLLRCIDSAPAAQTSAPAPAPQPVQPSESAPQSGAAQPAFFFRPRNVETKPSTTSTAPIQSERNAAQTSAPAPTPSSISTTSSTTTSTNVSVTTEMQNLFGKKPGAEATRSRRKTMISNLIFVAVLLTIIVAGIGLWVHLSEHGGGNNGGSSANAASVQKPKNPFVLYYEKEMVEGTSVFRFSLQLEMVEKIEESASPDGTVEQKKTRNHYMEVTLDEPKNGRRYYELFTDPIPETMIETLKKQILETGFMDLQQEKIAGTSQDNRQRRRIMVGFDNKFCDVSVSNDVSETFNRVESIISETLLDEYDLGVISQNVDRILEDAHTFLFVADEAFRSIDTTPSNLPKAIANYKLALRRYQLFDPKPAEWKNARDGLAKAEAKLEDIHQEGLRNVRLSYELREYSKAIAECNRLLEIFPPDSKVYKDIRDTKIKIENKMSGRNN